MKENAENSAPRRFVSPLMSSKITGELAYHSHIFVQTVDTTIALSKEILTSYGIEPVCVIIKSTQTPPNIPTTQKVNAPTNLKPATPPTAPKLCIAKVVTIAKSYNKNNWSPAEALAKEDEACYNAEVV